MDSPRSQGCYCDGPPGGGKGDAPPARDASFADGKVLLQPAELLALEDCNGLALVARKHHAVARQAACGRVQALHYPAVPCRRKQHAVREDACDPARLLLGAVALPLLLLGVSLLATQATDKYIYKEGAYYKLKQKVLGFDWKYALTNITEPKERDG